MKAQLPLFHPDAEAQRQLKEECRGLAVAHEALLTEYTAFRQAARTAHQELEAALARETREKAYWQARAVSWQQVAVAAPQPRAQSVNLDQIFKRLIALCHPDKWHNQPATDLAHELSIVINALREEVQP